MTAKVPAKGSTVKVDNGVQGVVIDTRYAPDPGEIVVRVEFSDGLSYWFSADDCEVQS